MNVVAIEKCVYIFLLKYTKLEFIWIETSLTLTVKKNVYNVKYAMNHQKIKILISLFYC